MAAGRKMVNDNAAKMGIVEQVARSCADELKDGHADRWIQILMPIQYVFNFLNEITDASTPS